jgi:hypothetical protein
MNDRIGEEIPPNQLLIIAWREFRASSGPLHGVRHPSVG